MGYTTNFAGQFSMDRRPSDTAILRLKKLQDHKADEGPGGYCQWQLTDDCVGIAWDGGEKFYDYVEWLQYIIDDILAPDGVTLSGSVAYSGEDSRDSGIMSIVDGKVVKSKNVDVRDEANELRQFRDYVLKTEWAEEILRGWRRHKTTTGGGR